MSIVIRNGTVWVWDSINKRDVSTNGRFLENMRIHVTDGVIKGVESDSAPYTSYVGITEIDASNQIIIPGLIDSHIHVEMMGESQYYVDLSGCRSISEMKSSLEHHIGRNPDLNWIVGIAWDQDLLSRYPTSHDLDEVCSTKPIFLWRACWHIGVANSYAMKLAGLQSECKELSIDGGIVDIDENGPTGIFREAAVNIITKVMGNKSYETSLKFIKEGLSVCLKHGLTSIQTNDASSVNVYKNLQQTNQLPIRVFLTPNYEDINAPTEKGGLNRQPPYIPPIYHNNNSHADDTEEILKKAVSMTGDEMLVINRVKIFSDGSLGAETAALRVPNMKDDNYDNNINLNNSVDGSLMDTNYPPVPPPSVKGGPIEVVADVGEGRSGWTSALKGVLIHDEKALRRMVGEATSLGYRLETHAIGDGAAEQVLKAYEYCGVTPEDRAIITHCQILGEGLISKMKALGVIANIQPSFVPTDMRWVRNRISSPQQFKYAYAWKTLLDEGIAVAGGSDSPVEPCSPFLGIYDAMMRRSRDDPADVFKPEERLSFAQALWIYTRGGAYASGVEHILGSIEAGFQGDLLIVDKEVMTNPELLRSHLPEVVIVRGRIVHEKNSIYRGRTSHSNIDTSIQQQQHLGNFVPGKNGPRGWTRNPWSCKCCRLGS